MKKKRNGWEHVGGGTALQSKSRYPCDDKYHHVKTGCSAYFETTVAAHFSMPRHVRSLAQLERLPGVRRTRCPHCGERPARKQGRAKA